MNISKFVSATIFLSVSSAFTIPAFAANNNCENMVKNVPGTYKLVKRVMPDGTVLTGNEAQGLLSFSKDGYRILAIAIHDPAKNTYNAISLQSRYTLTTNKFTDALLAFAIQNGNPSSGVQYMFDKPQRGTAVVCSDGALDIKNLPYDPVSDLKFSSNTVTAIVDRGPLKGVVDTWTKVS